MTRIKQNSFVLFYYNRNKTWLIKILKNNEFHTHLGIIKHNDAIGKNFGEKLVTNKNKYIYMLDPTIRDFIMKSQHGTQIVYPKDLGYIVSRTGLQSGQKVIEIGTGSGALTSFLASIVKPDGHVYTFDVNSDFMNIAKKNIMKAKMQNFITMNKLDLKISKPDITNADLVVIDLGDPWSVVPTARKLLKDSGAIISICPTINQLEKFVTSLIKNEFTDIECIENILRMIDAREGKTRHSFHGIGHTTYISYARKVYF